jgi:hypothetical protein
MFVCALTLALAAAGTAAAAQQEDVLFSDALDGTGPASAWRKAPPTFVDVPDGGRALRYERGTTWDSATQPWAGDETWSSYRVEVDVRPEKMWAGIDVHVQDDGNAASEVTITPASSPTSTRSGSR